MTGGGSGFDPDEWWKTSTALKKRVDFRSPPYPIHRFLSQILKYTPTIFSPKLNNPSWKPSRPKSHAFSAVPNWWQNISTVPPSTKKKCKSAKPRKCKSHVFYLIFHRPRFYIRNEKSPKRKHQLSFIFWSSIDRTPCWLDKERDCPIDTKKWSNFTLPWADLPVIKIVILSLPPSSVGKTESVPSVCVCVCLCLCVYLWTQREASSISHINYIELLVGHKTPSVNADRWTEMERWADRRWRIRTYHASCTGGLNNTSLLKYPRRISWQYWCCTFITNMWILRKQIPFQNHSYP